MKKNSFDVILIVLLFSLVLSACTPTKTKEPALTVKGLVDRVFSLDDLKAFPQTSSDYTDKNNETTTYNGVAFGVIFDDLKLAADPVSVKMIAIDDYIGDVTFEELLACTDCIVAILEDGTLRSVLPGFSGKANVRDLIILDLQ
ncbi:MAG: hypothetical protein MUO40_01590 [Anaerolineaceae bacterium]|nr:hypothetical protein [Anaerolineaceae bacterium]